MARTLYLVLLALASISCANTAVEPARAPADPGNASVPARIPGQAPMATQMPLSTAAGPAPIVPIVPPAAAAGREAPPAQVTRVREKVAIDECTGKLEADKLALLQAPGLAPGETRWLYPYDKTVFPRGLTAPVVQWDGPASQAILLHLQSAQLEYKGCFPLGLAASFAIPQAIWDKAGEQSQGGPRDPLHIDVTVLSGGKATRLPSLTAIFALATLKNAIYYNTYNSAIANASGITGGVVMRLLPKEPKASLFVSSPKSQDGACVGCHSVSADGSRMIVDTHASIFEEGPGSLYDLKATGMNGRPTSLQAQLQRAGFAALSPDGRWFVSQGNYASTDLMALASPGSLSAETSKLFDASTGALVADSGILPYVYMPMFSQDGRSLAFNHPGPSGAEGGHTLAAMSFDAATRKFSNLRTLWTDPSRYPSWPLFMPEVVRSQDSATTHGQRIVFALGDKADFVTQEPFLVPVPGFITPHPSDLWWLDVDTGKAVPLAQANGQHAGGETYLPYAQRDAHKNYYPTLSPVAAGGYFWLFFTSKRNYGNLFASDVAEEHPEAKKIWVSALDVDAAPGSDPSHPAFFLPGQELESGNIRAFAALSACREEGASCEAGIDCCCGFCSSGTCQCHMNRMCAQLDERCSTAADCCEPTASCIGQFCALTRGPD